MSSESPSGTAATEPSAPPPPPQKGSEAIAQLETRELSPLRVSTGTYTSEVTEARDKLLLECSRLRRSCGNKDVGTSKGNNMRMIRGSCKYCGRLLVVQRVSKG